MDKVTELKACPFCGARPKSIDLSDDAFGQVACENPDCPMQPSSDAGTYAEAITAWNTRATPALSVDREAIARIVDPEEWALDDFAKQKGERAQFIRNSLAKADAILSLPASPAASPLGDEERAREVLLQNIIAKPWSNDTSPAFWRDVRITANEAIAAMLAFRSSPASADEGVRESLTIALGIVEADLEQARETGDADWIGQSHSAHEALRAALSPETATTGGE